MKGFGFHFGRQMIFIPCLLKFLAQHFSSSHFFFFLLHLIFIFRLFDLFSSSGLLRLFSHLDLSSGGMLMLLRFVFPYIYISLCLCFMSKSIVHQSHFSILVKLFNAHVCNIFYFAVSGRQSKREPLESHFLCILKDPWRFLCRSC